MHGTRVAQPVRAPYRAREATAWHSGAMTDANLKGLSEDGTHLLVVTEAGDEVRVAITDELRALVRHARVLTRHDDAPPSGMTPREIQQRIRAGLNAAELSHLTGEPYDALAKFEAPVLAERAYVVELATSTRIGRDATSPTLGDLVRDRLAGRSIDPDSVVWDAWREVDEPWRVAADFPVAGRTLRALWTFDHVAKALTAEDDESTWLTETELLEAPIPRRHLSAVRADGASGAVPLVPAVASAPAEPFDDAIADDDADGEPDADSLLEDLAQRRGTREPLDLDEDDDEDDDHFEGFGPTRGAQQGAQSFGPSSFGPGSLGGPAPTTPAQGFASAGTARPATPTTMPHPAGSARSESGADAGDKKTRRGRASIPSWDEIVFGAKTD